MSLQSGAMGRLEPDTVIFGVINTNVFKFLGILDRRWSIDACDSDRKTLTARVTVLSGGLVDSLSRETLQSLESLTASRSGVTGASLGWEGRESVLVVETDGGTGSYGQGCCKLFAIKLWTQDHDGRKRTR